MREGGEAKLKSRQRRRSSQAQWFDELTLEPRLLFRYDIRRALWEVRPLYVFEIVMRTALVAIPELTSQSFPFVNRIMTLVYCYVFFQVLGLLWAFTLTAALALSIEASSWGARLISFIRSTDTDVVEDVGVVKAFSTLYVVYSIFRVIAQFGSAVGMVAWESLDDFPQVRRHAVIATGRWQHCLLLVLLPIVLLTMILMSTPSVCDAVCSPETEWEGSFDFLKASRWICCRAPILYLTLEYPKVRRTVKLALTLGIVQFLQLLLHHYPKWKTGLSRCSRWLHFSLNFLLSFCLGLTSLWSIKRLAGHFGIDQSDIVILRKYAKVDLDLLLISVWVTWLLVLSIVLSFHSMCKGIPTAGLRALVQNLKNTFIAACGLCFVYSCFDPDMGFLDAQAELTILTFIIPIFYTLIYLAVKMASNISIKLLVYGVPVAAFSATILCGLSAVGGLGSLLLVTFHIYGKFVLFYGNPPFEECDDILEYGSCKALKATDDSSLTSGNDVGKQHDDDGHGKLSIEEDAIKEQQHNRVSDELIRVSSPQRKKEDNCKAHRRRIATDGSRITRSDSSDARSLNCRPRSASVPSPTVSSVTNSFNKNARSLVHNIVEVLPSSLEGTNSVFVYKGIVNLMIAVIVICGVFIALFEILSHTQEHQQWYTSVVTLEHSHDQATISVNNAHISRMVLYLNQTTTSEESSSSDNGTSLPSTPLHPPRYAACESSWYGLSLVDYALISEIVYLGHVTDKEPMIEALQHFFPPDKTPNGPRFDLHVPGEEFSSKAQFVEIVEENMNLSIIAIRGTDVFRLSDLVEDMRMWIEPIVFSILSWIFPTIRIWPASTTSTVIEWLHEMLELFGLRFGHECDYYVPIIKYVKKVKEDGRNVVVTGHSLGGGLARIISSQELVTSICFSPPGIAQSYRKFHLSESQAGALHHASISVIPEYDFVSLIDTQVGMVQRIACRNHGKALQNACHMLEGTICELVNHCGDSRGRFTSCEFSYGFGNVFYIIWLRIWERIHWAAYAIPVIIIPALISLVFLLPNVM